jgi:3-hydroxyacyl-CoA dehydrogenase/enoyl-CoA hydratase/3-hydroxybutyryl-CoA epimerase
MADGLRHRLDADGVLRIVFDMPGERVNLLNAEILEELGRVLDDARGRDEVLGLLFASAKPGMFIAGMDVEQIASVTDAYRGAEAARFGQSVFQRIAAVGKPSVCAIGGPCLGGGTELALACSFRVASDDPAVKIGLPEVQLGIIPGFGGTQRLPRLIGMTPALELILTGRRIDAKRAAALGLVDLVVPAAYLEREALSLLRRAANEGTAAVASRLRRRQPLSWMLVEKLPPLRRYVLEQARKRTAKRADPRFYPGPFRAIEAVEASVSQTLEHGLDFEARLIGELIPTRTSKNLIWLFKSQTALKGSRLQATPRKIRRLSVLGAGIMGGGIAQLAADRNVAVRLKALRTARRVWQRRVDRRRMTRRELEQKMAFIAPTMDDTGLARIDMVIEAVVEDLEIKRKVLADIEQRIGERAVFASNTSSLPISEIAARALRPERVVGLHFFNPVHRMPLVEVIAGRLSSPEAVATAHAFAVRAGKTPVVVKDGPGFLVNRILTFYVNEALRLLTEGVRIEALDGAMTAFGMPMGPIALLDQIGLDTARHVGEVLQSALGDRVGGDPAVLDSLLEAGRLGRKSGKGFYRYRDDRRTTPDTDVYALIGSPPARDLPPETLQERMVLSMVNEAVVCLEEQVVRGPRDVDIAMVMGTGFPPFRGGLLRHADAVGVPIIADRLARLADAHGERFRPAEMLGEMVRGQRRFYPDG